MWIQNTGTTLEYIVSLYITLKKYFFAIKKCVLCQDHYHYLFFHINSKLSILYLVLREAAKKDFPLVVRPRRGVKAGELWKKKFFNAIKTSGLTTSGGTLFFLRVT